MRRKIIKQGTGSYTISLPKSWVKKHNLDAGDEIEISENIDTLQISGRGKPKQSVLEIDAKNMNYRIIEGYLTIAYKSGFDELRIRYNDNKIIESIVQTIRNRLLGFEIVEQNNSLCIIKNISSSETKEFNALVRRIMLITQSLFEDTIKYKNNPDKLKQIISLKESDDKLISLCGRMIIKDGAVPHSKAFYQYIILWVIDRINDTIEEICYQLLNKDGQVTCGEKLYDAKTNSSYLNISYDVWKMFDEIKMLNYNYYKLYYHFNDKQAIKLSNKNFKMIKQIKKLSDRSGHFEKRILERFLHICLRIDDLLSSTLGLNI